MSSFAVFKAFFKGDLITPENPEYEASIVRWAKNAQRKAQIVAYVKDSEDVAAAIKYARENKLHFSIKGGGHSTAGNSSSLGLVIDLSRYINTVDIDTENMLGYVGAGCIWETVDQAAIAKGVAAVGGTVNHTGVAGYTLGGGYGYLSGQYGLAIDNLVQATVVVADGSVLTASATENPDLFFGIRGGGCNFGVVTQFVFKVYPQRKKIFSGKILFPAEALDAVFEATEKWFSTIKENEGLMHNLSKGPNGPVIKTILFYNGSEAEGRANFKPFFDLNPIMDLTGEIPYEELNTQINPTVEYGKCRIFKGAFYVKPDLAAMKQVFERSVALTSGEHDTMVIFEHYNLKKIMSVPNGNSAFIRKAAGNTIIVTSWSNDTPENLAIARRNTKEVNAILVESQVPYIGNANQGYGNYDQDGTEENNIGIVKSSAENLFSENYPKLQQIKKKYDPENIFANWFAITPAA